MTKEKAEILFVQNKRFNFAPYSVNWVSNSTKFIACGQKRTGTGVFAICNIQEGKINVIQEVFKLNEKNECIEMRFKRTLSLI